MGRRRAVLRRPVRTYDHGRMNWPPRQPVRLLVVMTVYRSADLAVECLRSLESQIEDVPGTFVAICENGSGADEARRLREAVEANGWSSWVGIREVDPNRGFTGGNNAILEPAMQWPEPPELFLLLNTDTLVGPGMLARMVGFLEGRPEVGIATPQLLDRDGDCQVCAFNDPSVLGEFLRAASTGVFDHLFPRFLTRKSLPHDEGPHDWVCFASAFIRRDVIQTVGVLDDGYFLYLDDPDYCWRARRAGWDIAMCDAATTVHLEGGSNDVPASVKARRRLPRFYYQSRARYFAKRHGIVGLWLANLCWHAGRCISFARDILQWRPWSVPKSAWRDIWTNAFRPWHAPHLPHPPLEDEDRDVSTDTGGVSRREPAVSASSH